MAVTGTRYFGDGPLGVQFEEASACLLLTGSKFYNRSRIMILDNVMKELHEQEVVLRILTRLEVLSQDQKDFEDELLVKKGNEGVMQIRVSSGRFG